MVESNVDGAQSTHTVGPAPTPEETQKLNVIGNFLADVIGRRWLQTGVWKGLLEGISKRIHSNPDLAGRSLDTISGLLERSSKKVKVVQPNPETGELEERETTVPQLLADILEQLDELNDQMSESVKQNTTKKKRKRRR